MAVTYLASRIGKAVAKARGASESEACAVAQTISIIGGHCGDLPGGGAGLAHASAEQIAESKRQEREQED